MNNAAKLGETTVKQARLPEVTCKHISPPIASRRPGDDGRYRTIELLPGKWIPVGTKAVFCDEAGQKIRAVVVQDPFARNNERLIDTFAV
jgi:hypothetical protein